LEEQVLDELDTLHIARGPVQQKRHCRLFAINRGTLQTVLTGLSDQGLQPREIYLDADCLPGDAPAAVWCNDRWLIGNLPTTRMALGEQERAELPTLLPENLPWQTPDDEDALLLHLHSTHAIDLRQGEFCYVPPRRLTWRLPMLIVTLCVGVLLAYTVGHRLVLEQQTAVLHEQNVSDFRQRFPDEQRIVNLRQQVAQRQEQPGGAPQGIARRLDQLAQNWIASGGAAAAIRHVQYQAGEGWTLQVSAPAFADLEQIRTGLTQQNLAVQSNSTVRDANGVSSQFKIGE
jgi:general secretion pathway protein L